VLSQHPTLRHHKLKIAFFNSEGEILEVKDAVITNQETTKILYNGTKNPVAIILNYQDEAFVKIRIDNHSIEFFKKNFTKLKCEFTKALIWRSLWDMTRDAHLSIAEFVEIGCVAIQNEPSDQILTNILNFSSVGIAAFSPKAFRHDVLHPKLFTAIKTLLLITNKSLTNRIVLLKEHLISNAQVGINVEIDNLSFLLSWFNGEN